MLKELLLLIKLMYQIPPLSKNNHYLAWNLILNFKSMLFSLLQIFYFKHFNYVKEVNF